MCAGDERKSTATLFGRTLASITRNQSAGQSPYVEPEPSQTDVAVTGSEGTSEDNNVTPSGML